MSFRVRVLPSVSLLLIFLGWVSALVGVLSLSSGWGHSSTYDIGWQKTQYNASLQPDLKRAGDAAGGCSIVSLLFGFAAMVCCFIAAFKEVGKGVSFAAAVLSWATSFVLCVGWITWLAFAVNANVRMMPSHSPVLEAAGSVFLGLAGTTLLVSVFYDLEWRRTETSSSLETRLLTNQYR